MNGCDIIPTGTGILADGPCYVTSVFKSHWSWLRVGVWWMLWNDYYWCCWCRSSCSLLLWGWDTWWTGCLLVAGGVWYCSTMADLSPVWSSRSWLRHGTCWVAGPSGVLVCWLRLGESVIWLWSLIHVNIIVPVAIASIWFSLSLCVATTSSSQPRLHTSSTAFCFKFHASPWPVASTTSS